MLFPLWFQRSPSTSSPPRLHLVVGSQLNCQSRPDTNQRFVPADSKIISLAVHRLGYGVHPIIWEMVGWAPITLSMCKFRSFPKNHTSCKTHISKTTHLPKEDDQITPFSCDTAKSLGVAEMMPLQNHEHAISRWQWKETIPFVRYLLFWKRIAMSCGTLWYSKSIFISSTFPILSHKKVDLFPLQSLQSGQQFRCQCIRKAPPKRIPAK